MGTEWVLGFSQPTGSLSILPTPLKARCEVKPIRLYELKPVQFSMLRYWNGTRKTFGIKSAITTVSPLANFILNFKYREYKLEIDMRAFINLATKDGKEVKND